MSPPQKDEPLSSFTTRINKIQSIYDCINPVNTSGLIKVARPVDFEQRTLMLFDVIGLLNGLGYFKGHEEELSKNPSSIKITTIYDLLDYWYGCYIYEYRKYKRTQTIQQIIKDINQEVFLNGFWVDVACYNYLRDTFYYAIDTARREEIKNLIDAFPQNGGNRNKKMSIGTPDNITT